MIEMNSLIAITLIAIICGIFLGIRAMVNDTFESLWKSASLIGKVFTCIYVVISLPGIIIYLLALFISSLFDGIRTLAFPRKYSNYRIKIVYDKNLYEVLKENKIYFEHWGQCNLESSVIVFLWKKDYEKALKLIPDLKDRIADY